MLSTFSSRNMRYNSGSSSGARAVIVFPLLGNRVSGCVWRVEPINYESARECTCRNGKCEGTLVATTNCNEYVHKREREKKTQVAAGM